MNGKDRMGRCDGSSLRLEKESFSSEYEVFVCVALCEIQKKKKKKKKKIKSTFKHTTAKH